MFKPFVKEYYKSEFWNTLPFVIIWIGAFWNLLDLADCTTIQKVFVEVMMYFFVEMHNINQFRIDKLEKRLNELENGKEED